MTRSIEWMEKWVNSISINFECSFRFSSYPVDGKRSLYYDWIVCYCCCRNSVIALFDAPNSFCVVMECCTKCCAIWVNSFRIEYSINSNAISQFNAVEMTHFDQKVNFWWAKTAFNRSLSRSEMYLVQWNSTDFSWKSWKLAMFCELLLAESVSLASVHLFNDGKQWNAAAWSNHWIVKKEIYYWKLIHGSFMMTALPIK